MAQKALIMNGLLQFGSDTVSKSLGDFLNSFQMLLQRLASLHFCRVSGVFCHSSIFLNINISPSLHTQWRLFLHLNVTQFISVIIRTRFHFPASVCIGDALSTTTHIFPSSYSSPTAAAAMFTRP
jgi:hypothetical protein